MKEQYGKSIVEWLSHIRKHYPEVATKIEANWGNKKGHDYLKYLLNKDREIRNGFPPIVYYHIMHMYCIHLDLVGDFESPITVHNPNLDLSLLDYE